MAASFPISISYDLSQKKLTRSSNKFNGWDLTRKKSVVCCQNGGNEITSPSVEILGAALMDAKSLVLSPNAKKNQGEVNGVKELVPYTAPPTSLMEKDDGIGIVKFLKGKGLLITGATGFVAKVLTEKILRTVPNVGKIFLLIRVKNKESAMERLKSEIINTELFKSLHQTHGESYQAFMLSKLVPVVGNVCESNLGLDDNLADIIANEVDVIVNSAANTTFDERYDVALDINTKGPCRIMSFAKNCKKLKLFLQVSTAYVNGQRQGKIMEKAFSIGDSIARESFMSEVPTKALPELDIEAEMKLALGSKESFKANEIAQKMKELGLERARKYGWQDTYAFTKAMGEMLIDDMKGEIPVVIIRPSIIESTFKEPFPGWIEGNRMMDPVVISYGKGQLTGFLSDPNVVLDVVPVDMVVNATLAAMAKHAIAGKPETNIYQIASSVVNPVVFGNLTKLFYEHFKSVPYVDSKGNGVNVRPMKHFSSMDDFSSHLRKDIFQRLELSAMAGSKGKMSHMLEKFRHKAVEQAKHLASIYEPYTFYGGRFDNSNTQKLLESMSEDERRNFGFDVRSINWKEYISNVHIPGLRRHVMKGRGLCN